MTDILSFEARGKGPGLVLLHGGGSTGSGTWGTVLEPLTATYRVILPDLPGSGKSPLPDAALDVETISDQVVATARAAGLEEFAVAGVSMGAAVAIKIAARYPERVRALSSLVGFAYPRTGLRLSLELLASLLSRADKDLGKFLASHFFSEQYLAALPAEAVQEVIQQFAGLLEPGAAAQVDLSIGIDVRHDLRAIRTPTLIVAATGDRLVAPEQSAELVNGIADARLVEVGGGHVSLFENPRPNQEALLAFLESVLKTT